MKAEFKCVCGRDRFFETHRYLENGQQAKIAHTVPKDSERANPVTIQCTGCAATYIYDIDDQKWVPVTKA